jgi:putative pre-16S rRNA nuclease
VNERIVEEAVLGKDRAGEDRAGEDRMAHGPGEKDDLMRALGIDFGEKRIGLALSDADGRWALPWKVIERETDRRAIYRIADLVRQEGVTLLAVGEPLGLDGSAGPAAARARRFGDRLAAVTGLPVRWVNEALTTVEASERLREAGGGAEARGVDAVAAQILLQEVLDRESAT